MLEDHSDVARKNAVSNCYRRRREHRLGSPVALMTDCGIVYAFNFLIIYKDMAGPGGLKFLCG